MGQPVMSETSLVDQSGVTNGMLSQPEEGYTVRLVELPRGGHGSHGKSEQACNGRMVAGLATALSFLEGEIVSCVSVGLYFKTRQSSKNKIL